jgi:hypothetical protein
MKHPIVARFRWTVEELLAARRWHFKHICRPIFRVGMYFIAAVALLAGVASILAKESPAFGWAILIGATYFILLRPLEVRFFTRYRFSKRPDSNVDVEWEFTSERICIRTPLSTSEIIWELFSKVVHTPTGMLFYPNDQIFHWVPRHAFANSADFEQITEVARSNVKRFYNLS